MRGTTDVYTGPPTIYLKIGRLQAEASARGWVTARELAEGIGTSEANISRLLDENPAKRQTPGSTFIASVLCAFPNLQFEDFFLAARADLTMRRAS